MKKTITPFFILIFLLLTIQYGYGQNLNKEEIQAIANNLLITNKYHVSIKKIVPPVNGIQVVVLSIPYREFPGIIIINKNKSTGKWERVFESLSPGIQDKSSGLLDWHTKGEGVDFMIDKMSMCNFSDKRIKTVVETSIKKNGVIIIPYQHFIHMNTVNATSPGFAPYTIDKTEYFDFANTLFDNLYSGYPKNECTMFDTPGIRDCEFTSANNLYKIKVTTDSNQIWTYTFEGIDAKNQYLLNKKIAVAKGM
ncbi:hypothetical protein ACPPVU_00510 [Mucilaginibacter sp. McL0603]|uniref:hypothetical protein n=1 Tax=Mucilaginibacter sp. McL0603 TaxID=3415670 RepID=UPI003CEF7D8B